MLMCAVIRSVAMLTIAFIVTQVNHWFIMYRVSGISTSASVSPTDSKLRSGRKTFGPRRYWMRYNFSRGEQDTERAGKGIYTVDLYSKNQTCSSNSKQQRQARFPRSAIIQAYPLAKGRWLPWAPKRQGPPKMLFIHEMRIKRGYANVYDHDNHLRVRVERASCVSCL